MKANLPLVSVYITNYNYAIYIKQSIESALQQTLQDFELFIIDDGSTDNSKDIIEQYRDNDKISIIYQQNKGLNVTNNIAMRASNGKYLMRLDADDFLEPTALEQMSSMLEANEELGLVFPDYYYVDKEGRVTGEERRHNFEREVSLFDQPAHGACTMIRLQFLKDLGGYNESFTCQDGYDLWIKFIMHHKVTNINQPLFSYRRHGDNLTTNEDRILNTRKKIKEAFVKEHLTIPKSLAIIPVRNSFIGSHSWPLFEINGKAILEDKVTTCLQSSIDTIVISSSDENILSFARQKFEGLDKVVVMERPKGFAGVNETLSNTVLQALSYLEGKGRKFDILMTVSLEYPFIAADILDDAINTIVLFKSDAVLSVRPDNHVYYQHTGHTLKPILDQDKFTRLEREALYKGAGGIVAASVKSFMQNGNMISGSISHVVVNNKSAFGVFSEFDFQLVTSYFNDNRNL